LPRVLGASAVSSRSEIIGWSAATLARLVASGVGGGDHLDARARVE
jgi:hypothetical protein